MTPYDQLQSIAPTQGRNFPYEIEATTNEHYRISIEIADLHFDLGLIIDPITADVASDNAYKNDTARKAEVKLRLSNSDDYARLDKLLRAAEHKRAEMTARIERLRGEFSLFKLAWRERIARLENESD